MNAHVWTKMAMASALMVWGMTAQAQTSSSGGVSAGQGVAAPQTRPAPVTGKVGSDPAAVALRPAVQAPVTSKATQVAPPANPNEPLFSPTAETPARAAAVVSTTATPKTAEPVAQQRKPHVDRTEGVKKPSKTAPQAHDKKVQGKPLHARKGSASNKDAGQSGSTSKDAHKGKKKADKSAAVHQLGNGKHVTPSAPSAHKGLAAQQAKSKSTKKHPEQAAAGKHAASPKMQAKAASSQRVARTSAAVSASTGKGAKHHTASAAHQAGHTATAKSTVAAKASAPAAGKAAHKNANKAARSAHKPA